MFVIQIISINSKPDILLGTSHGFMVVNLGLLFGGRHDFED